MRERLLVHLRSLPQIVEGWNRLEESDSQPSQFARSLTKVTKIEIVFSNAQVRYSVSSCNSICSLPVYVGNARLSANLNVFSYFMGSRLVESQLKKD